MKSKNWYIGLYRNAAGVLSSVYVNSKGEPHPGERGRVGGRPILFHRKLSGPGLTFSEARRQLVEEAIASGIPYQGDGVVGVKPPVDPAEKPSRLGPGLRVAKPVTGMVDPLVAELWTVARMVHLPKTPARSKDREDREAKNAIHWSEWPGADFLIRLASLTMFVVTTVGVEPGMRVNAALKLLFFSRTRYKEWGRALDLLPADAKLLLQVADHVDAYQRHVKKDDLRSGQYKLHEVLSCMLEVPNPDVYVRHVSATGIVHPRALYHPNTVRVARDQLRGSLGRRPEQHSVHVEHIRKKVKRVGD